jgi:hypothetical protein
MSRFGSPGYRATRDEPILELGLLTAKASSSSRTSTKEHLPNRHPRKSGARERRSADMADLRQDRGRAGRPARYRAGRVHARAGLTTGLAQVIRAGYRLLS